MTNMAIIIEADHHNQKGKVVHISNDEERAFKALMNYQQNGDFVIPKTNKTDQIVEDALEHHLIILDEALVKNKQFKLMNLPPNKHVYTLAHHLDKIHTIIDDIQKD